MKITKYEAMTFLIGLCVGIVLTAIAMKMK